MHKVFNFDGLYYRNHFILRLSIAYSDYFFSIRVFFSLPSLFLYIYPRVPSYERLLFSFLIILEICPLKCSVSVRISYFNYLTLDYITYYMSKKYSYPIYTETYHIRWVTTSWTYSIVRLKKKILWKPLQYERLGKNVALVSFFFSFWKSSF